MGTFRKRVLLTVTRSGCPSAPQYDVTTEDPDRMKPLDAVIFLMAAIPMMLVGLAAIGIGGVLLYVIITG